jgi:hypothetical protein
MCSLIAEETCPQSCSLVMAVGLHATIYHIGIGDFKSPGLTGLMPMGVTEFVLNDVQGLMGYMMGSE